MRSMTSVRINGQGVKRCYDNQAGSIQDFNILTYNCRTFAYNLYLAIDNLPYRDPSPRRYISPPRSARVQSRPSIISTDYGAIRREQEARKAAEIRAREAEERVKAA